MPATKTEDLYSFLNCDKSASFEELKQNYQKLIKIYHPDKQQCDQQLNKSHYDKYLDIERAWRTLRNEDSRQHYDKSQMRNDLNNVSLIHATLKKSGIIFTGDNPATYPCRCGGLFEIHQSYLSQQECLIECNECSNCIVIE